MPNVSFTPVGVDYGTRCAQDRATARIVDAIATAPLHVVKATPDVAIKQESVTPAPFSPRPLKREYALEDM